MLANPGDNRDIKDTLQAKAHREAKGRRDVESVVIVDEKGIATELYKVGNQENLGVADALDFMRRVGIRVKRS
jgi:hypothetical protein